MLYINVKDQMQLYCVVRGNRPLLQDIGVKYPTHFKVRELQVQAPLLTELFILHLGGIVKEKRHHMVSAINYNIPSRFRLKRNREYTRTISLYIWMICDFTSFSTVVLSY